MTRLAALALGGAVIACAAVGTAVACSVFNHSGTDTLMVGRNLDWVSSSEGRIGFLHPTCDGHGAIYFYIDDHVWPQGGMNDQDLVLGMTATPYLEITVNPDGAAMGWDFWDDLFAGDPCAEGDDDDSGAGDDDAMGDDDDSAPAQDDDSVQDGAGGCGCGHAGDTRTPTWLVQALVALLLLRRWIRP